MATAPHVQLGSSAIEVVAGNAFRILGLPARASEGDVRIAASAMRSGLKLGITKSTVWDSPWLGPLSRTEETVEDAVARLRDPARRLRERFFWFHDGDELMPSLALASLENTASRWSLAPGLSARHDAALLMLLAAVLSDPEVQNESQWLRALREWKQVIEADDYWAALWAADAEGDFRPAATVEEVEALREEAFHLVGGILATVAREAVTRDALPSCRRALRVFNRARLPQEVLAVLESEVFAPIEAHLDAVCAELRRLCGAAEALPSPSASSEPGEERAATRADCEAALARFDAEVEPALRKIEELAGAGSDQTRRAQEATALCLEALALSDVWSTDTTSAQALLRRARLIAPSYSPVASRIEASLATMAVRAQQERQFKSAKPNEGSPEPAPVAAPAPPPPTGPASLPAAPGPPAARSEPGREFPGSPIWENLKPVKRPPPLFNLIGFGFGLYGKSDIDLDTRSYLTTHYLTALFLPLLPLGRYRIRDTMKGHRFLGRAPFGRRNVWHLLFLLALIVASLVLSSYRDVARSLPLLATPTPTVTATPTLRPTPRPTRTPSPTPTLTPSPTVAPTPTPTVIVYVVQPGDVLNVIASRYGVTIEAILAANPQITNPDSLEIGQEIVIPQPPQ